MMKKVACLIAVLCALGPVSFAATKKENAKLKVFVSLTAWENELGKNDGRDPQRFYAVLEPKSLNSPKENIVCTIKVGPYGYRVRFGAEEWETKNLENVHSWFLSAGQVVDGKYMSSLFTVIALPLARESGNNQLNVSLPVPYSVVINPTTDEGGRLNLFLSMAKELNAQELHCSVEKVR